MSWNEDSDTGDVTGWSAEGDDWITGPTDFAYPCWGTITQEYHSNHKAIDVGNDTGTYIGAAADATVAVADTVDDSACGKYVILDHGDGWETTYCHLSKVSVSEGQSVDRDEKIGEMGDTGHSTGPHLHWSIDHNDTRQSIPGFDGQDLVGGSGNPKDYF